MARTIARLGDWIMAHKCLLAGYSGSYLRNLHPGLRLKHWVLITCGLERKWPILQMLIACLGCGLTALKITYFQWRDNPTTEETFLLSNVSLVFGPFEKIFNLASLIGFWQLTFAMLINILYYSTDAKRRAWYTAWTKIVDKRRFKRLAGMKHDTERVVAFWKFAYGQHILGIIAGILITITVTVFTTYSETQMPVPEGWDWRLVLFIRVLLAIHFLFNNYTSFCFITQMTGACMSQLRYYSMRMACIVENLVKLKHLYSHSDLSFATFSRSSLVVFSLLKDWETIRLEFKGQADILPLLTFVVVGLTMPTILMFLYVASYLSAFFILKVTSVTVLSTATIVWTEFYLEAAAIQWSRRRICHELQAIYLRIDAFPFRGNAITAKQRILKTIQQENYNSELVCHCWILFPVTAENFLWVLCEMASYYSLVISTIGIPTDEDIAILLKLDKQPNNL